MKKSMLLSFALVTAGVMGTTSAMALDVIPPRPVSIFHGVVTIPVGTWFCDEGQYQAVMGAPIGNYNACRYICNWVSNSFLPLSTNLYIDEVISPGFADCAQNSQTQIPATIFLTPGVTSNGFDRNQAKRQVTTLILGEGVGVLQMNGSIAFANNGNFTTYALVVN